MSGVDPTGFNRKLLDDILSEIEADQKAAISPSLNTLATSVLGQLNGIFADKLREIWEVMEAVYNAHYPDTASGQSLDAVSAITGALRLPATQSDAVVSCNLDAGVTLPAGSVVSNASTGERWQSTEDVTNTGGSPDDFDVDFVSQDFGPIAGPAQALRKIETPVTGWNEVAATILSGNSQPFSLADGQNLFVEVDDGAQQQVTFLTGDFVDIGNATAAEVAAVIDAALNGASSVADDSQVRITSDDDGFASALKNNGGTAQTALDFPLTRVVGSPFNALDAIPGTNIETDSEFRTRREQLLRATGKASLEAIRAKLLNVDDVMQALVFENVTMVTDLNGIPPKAIEAVVQGGADEDIAHSLFDNKPAGIETHGSESEIIEDSQGFFHTIEFSRPIEVRIYIEVGVTTDDSYPIDGDDQLKAVLKSLGDSLQISDDVIYERFQAECFQVQGVVDVPTFFIDTVTPPTGISNIAIAARELATFDTGDITVL